MMYAIKVKSQKRWDSLLEELEEKGWSWYSGRKPTSRDVSIPTWVGDGDDYLSLDSDTYILAHSGKDSGEGYKKIKSLDQLPPVDYFQVRVTSKKEVKSTLRHLAVRGYKWPSGEPILAQWLKLWEGKSGAIELGESMWLKVGKETGRLNWDNEKFKDAKEVNLDVFDLPFVEDENMQMAFTCWKTFKKALKILEKEDFLWVNGKKPTEWVCDDWSKENFSVKLIIWEKRSNGDSKRISWDY